MKNDSNIGKKLLNFFVKQNDDLKLMILTLKEWCNSIEKNVIRKTKGILKKNGAKKHKIVLNVKSKVLKCFK